MRLSKQSSEGFSHQSLVTILTLFLLGFHLALGESAGLFRPYSTTVGRNSFQNLGDDSNARMKANLLFDKKILTSVFAIGWKIELEYLLVNSGNEIAEDVHIWDEDFAGESSKFNVTQGQADLRIGRILPGASVTVNITAVPNSLLGVGSFQFQSAKVIYRSLGEEEVVLEDEIVGWSSLSHFQHGTVNILTQEDAYRLHSSKTFEILVLILLCLPTVVVPMAMWKSQSVKYDKLQELSDAIRRSKTKKGRAKL